MKKILLVSLMFLMFAGVVSASSINGDYNGNPIVKLKSNGSLIDTGEVPAMIYDGKTMVPIAALRNLGADVTWDAQTYSVEVKMPVSTITTNNNAQDINNLKLYMKIANHYKRLTLLGEMLQGVGNSIGLVFDAIQVNSSPSNSLDTAFNRLNERINSYNEFIKTNDSMILEASTYGINITNTRDIMDKYNKSIDYLKLSYQGIEAFYYNNNNTNFNQYLDNRRQADTLINGGIENSDSGYFDYFFKTQNY